MTVRASESDVKAETVAVVADPKTSHSKSFRRACKTDLSLEPAHLRNAYRISKNNNLLLIIQLKSSSEQKYRRTKKKVHICGQLWAVSTWLL